MLSSRVRHEVSFWHGPDRCSGDLRLPTASGPHPVLVVVREPHHRQRDYSPWLDRVADAGIASFTWDRAQLRDGDPGPRRPIAHQAREVLAAVERLGRLPEVDAAATALVGWGEGGWAAARAATYSDRLAALILACTPAPDPAAHPAAGEGHDPRPTLSALTLPVLALFGEQDPLVPLVESVRGVRTALADAGHVDHEVAVVRGADHGLRVRAPHGLGPMVDGLHRFGDWPPPLTRLVVEWLEARLRPDGVPSYAPPLRPAAAPLRPHPRPAGVPAAASPAAPSSAQARTAAALAALPAGVPVRQVRRRVAH